MFPLSVGDSLITYFALIDLPILNKYINLQYLYHNCKKKNHLFSIKNLSMRSLKDKRENEQEIGEPSMPLASSTQLSEIHQQS